MTSARAVTYKPEILEGLRAKLAQLPEPKPEQVTKREIIRSLAHEIHELQMKGYSLRAIATIMCEEGVSISSTVLKSYLARTKPRGKKSMRQRAAQQDCGATVIPDNGLVEPQVETLARMASVEMEAMQKDTVKGTDRAVPAEAPRGETGRTAPVSSVGAPRAAAAERRPMPEGDKRKSAFMPKEDSRDI